MVGDLVGTKFLYLLETPLYSGQRGLTVRININE